MGIIVKPEDAYKKELKKHVAAIRVSNNVGLLARKSWNVMLLNAYDALLDNTLHQIPVSVLSEVIGYNSESYESLENALQKLQTTLVKWDIGGGCEVGGKWINNMKSSQMLGAIRIQDGVIHYEFSKMFAEELYNPEIYQRISLSQQKLFKSSHSLALWENCLRYIGVGSTGFSDIDEWKDLLGVSNKKAYSQFYRFNERVLKGAIKEINKLSNIHIELQTEKRGRRVTKIGFLVTENKQQTILVDEAIDTIKSSTEYQELLDIGISKVQTLSWIQEHGFQYIREKIDLLNKNKQLGTLKNPSGFLVKSIERDFSNPEKEEEKLQAKKAAERKNRERKREEREQAINKLESEFMQQSAQEYVQGLNEGEQAELLQELKKFPVVGMKIKTLSDPMAIGLITTKIPDFQERQKAYAAERIK